jgi:rubrerythrin
MKKIMSLLMGAALLVSVQVVRADDATGTAMSTPTTKAAPVAKKKAKKSKKKAAPKASTAAKTYICTMDGYTSDKPGKCPKCGMDLVEKK